MQVHTNTCMSMFMAALFLRAPKWQQGRRPSLHKWTGKQIMGYPHNGMLFSNKNANTGNNLGESSKSSYWAKKPDTERVDSLVPFTWGSSRGDTNLTRGHLGPRVEGGIDYKRHEGTFQGDKNMLHLNSGGCVYLYSCLYEFVKTFQNVQVDF